MNVTLWKRAGSPLLSAAAAAAITLAATLPAEAQRAPAPKLIVLVVVDQMRADYLERFGAPFKGGLRRLMQQGAWFTHAAYPYLNTVTCPGHSTIGTGAFPWRHGMILNAWLDRGTGKSPACTDDPTVRDISYNGLPPMQGDSAKLLLVPALAEQVRASSHGRSVGISLKPRSAIPLVGHAADAVVWFDERGGWSTSSAYSRDGVPFVKQFVDGHPITADYDKVWNRSLDLRAYQGEDDAAAERPGSGMTRTFPHALGVRGGKPDVGFYGRWQRSPFSDEYLGAMAAAAVDAMKLGQRGSLDFLAVSFSALDLVGHSFGPRSHEVQDLLVRLDATVGKLLDHLDRQVGPNNYVVALSADHGVADIPEQARQGGRVTNAEVGDALQKELVRLLGPGKHVAAVEYTDIYLSAPALRRLERQPHIGAQIVAALRALPAIAQAFRGSDLATAAARRSSDPVRRAAALSYHAGRSGDFIIVPKTQWLLSSAATTHGTLYPYDQRVPLIFYGASIKPGRYSQEATPADLAPTVAAVVHVKIAPTDGKVLSQALAPAARARGRRETAEGTESTERAHRGDAELRRTRRH